MKVLFVDSTVIGENSPTGATLNHVFQSMKDVEVLQYCIDYAPEFHTPSFDTVYEDKKYNPFFFCIKSLYRKKFSQRVSESNYETNVSTKGSTMGNTAKFVLDCIPHRVGPEEMRRIRAFAPDVIYALGGTITTLRVAYKLSVLLDCPVVLHIMDDWFSTKYLDCKLTKYGNRLINQWAQKVLKRTVYNIGISEKMARHYEDVFKLPFSNAMNCITELHETPQPDQKPLRFLFSGGIHGGRETSLYEMGKLIKASEKLSENIKLVIYTSSVCLEKYRDLLSPVAEMHEYVPRSELYANLAGADVLVHVESFQQSEIDYFRYSLSTKIPEYMSTNRPILCFGPEEIGTVSYVAEHGVGLCAADAATVQTAMNELLNLERRKQLGQKGLQVARDDHLTDNVAARVRAVLDKSRNEWSK